MLYKKIYLLHFIYDTCGLMGSGQITQEDITFWTSTSVSSIFLLLMQIILSNGEYIF